MLTGTLESYRDALERQALSHAANGSGSGGGAHAVNANGAAPAAQQAASGLFATFSYAPTAARGPPPAPDGVSLQQQARPTSAGALAPPQPQPQAPPRQLPFSVRQHFRQPKQAPPGGWEAHYSGPALKLPLPAAAAAAPPHAEQAPPGPRWSGPNHHQQLARQSQQQQQQPLPGEDADVFAEAAAAMAAQHGADPSDLPQAAGAPQPPAPPQPPRPPEYIPRCPYACCPGVFTFCGAGLRWRRRGAAGGFWGCSSFPACDYK